jgi:ribosomal-protein-alanine N-acetyltransferase
MNYQLREMKIEDIEEIVKGEEKVFGHSLGYDLIYSDLALNPYALYVVLEIEEKIHGYVGMWITDNLEIINLYVDEEYQGMGFGSIIMEFVIDICEQSNISNLSLEVRSSNVKAINLYEKYGLKKSHIRKNYYVNENKETEDAIVMVRTFEVK